MINPIQRESSNYQLLELEFGYLLLFATCANPTCWEQLLFSHMLWNRESGEYLSFSPPLNPIIRSNNTHNIPNF